MLVHRLIEANDGNGVISIELHEGLADAVQEKPPAVVVLVENFDVTGHDVKGIHPLDLLLLLLALGKGPVFGKLVDVVQNLFLLVGKQIFEDFVDVLTEQKRVVFFGIVEDTDEPVEMIVVE